MAANDGLPDVSPGLFFFFDDFLATETYDDYDDDDISLLYFRHNTTKIAAYFETTVQNDTAIEFHSHFRMTASAAEMLTRLIVVGHWQNQTYKTTR